MALSLTLNQTDARIAAALNVKSEVLVSALTNKMAFLMTKLQQRIVNQKLSGEVLNRRSGTLAASITNPEAHAEGGSIVGTLEWAGGPAWYGRVHEYGGTGAYVINPIYTRSQARRISKGTLKPFKALRFIASSGEVVYAAYVFHPALPRRSFMQATIEEMRGEFIAGLKQTITTVLSGLE